MPSAPAQLHQQTAPGLQQQAGVDAEVDLDDDDPVLAWQRRRRQGTMGAAAAVAIVVVIAGVLTLRGSGHDDVPASVRSQVQTALSQGDAASRDRALKALQDFTHSGGAVAAAPVRARLLAEEARGLREAIRLSDEAKAIAVAMQAAPPTGTTAPTAVAHAEQVLAEAGAIVMSSRAAGHDLADVDLATATAALATGDLSALQAATTLAREHAQAEDATTRAAVDDELRLILSLAEASQVSPTDTDAAQVATEKLARFGDVRARAATAVISLVAVRGARLKALAQIPPVAVDGAVVEHARAAFAALPVSDPRRGAAEGLLSALTTLPPPPPEPTVDPAAVPVPGTPVPGAPVPGPGDGAVPVVEETFDALMTRGEKALVTERSAVAYEAFKKATQKNPANARAWLKLGWASLDTGKKSEAPRAFERALAASPSLAEARFGLAEALRFAGRTDEAIAAYKAYLAQDPTGKDANIAKNALKQLE
jgi:tetratricopeptide (TPR) repeat protein